MGRFARSQDKVESGRLSAPPDARANFNYSSPPEIKSSEARAQSSKSVKRLAKGKKLFWAFIISLAGLSAGWMMARVWLKPPEVALAQSAPATEAVSESGEVARKASVPNPQAQSLEQGAQDQSYEQGAQADNQKPGRPRRAQLRSGRARGRSATASSPVKIMLKPFKAINPMKLRRLRIW